MVEIIQGLLIATVGIVGSRSETAFRGALLVILLYGVARL